MDLRKLANRSLSETILMSQFPIPLPARITGGNNTPITARWANDVRESLARLAKRKMFSGAGGGAAGGGYVPWKPAFSFTEPSTYTVRFNLGTINNVAPSNWDEDHTLAADDTKHWVILEVTTTNGKVTGLEIVVQDTALTDDYVNKDTPPPLHKIVLGVIGKSSGFMIENTNFNAVAVEVYRESKTATSPGDEPFSRYWRWQRTSV